MYAEIGNGRYKNITKIVMFITHFCTGIILTMDIAINGFDTFQIFALVWLYIHLFSRIVLILVDFYPLGVFNLRIFSLIIGILLEIYGVECCTVGIYRIIIGINENRDIWLMVLFILIFDGIMICVSAYYRSPVSSIGETPFETSMRRIEVKTISTSQSQESVTVSNT